MLRHSTTLWWLPGTVYTSCSSVLLSTRMFEEQAPISTAVSCDHIKMLDCSRNVARGALVDKGTFFFLVHPLVKDNNPAVLGARLGHPTSPISLGGRHRGRCSVHMGRRHVRQVGSRRRSSLHDSQASGSAQHKDRPTHRVRESPHRSAHRRSTSVRMGRQGQWSVRTRR